MIQANELRIGNWIHNPVQEINFQVDLATIGNVARDNGNKNKVPSRLLYQPIPITEEILLKCGFEKKKQRFESKEALLRISYFDSAWHCSIGDDDFGFLFRTIKHLHQLQNLYFALTGKELQIEL